MGCDWLEQDEMLLFYYMHISNRLISSTPCTLSVACVIFLRKKKITKLGIQVQNVLSWLDLIKKTLVIPCRKGSSRSIHAVLSTTF